MLFNLVGPLIVRQDLSPLEIAFKRNNIFWLEEKLKASLEFEDRRIFNEDAGLPTSIDLIIQEETGLPRIVVESKLVEREFGGCSMFTAGDCDGRNPTGDFSLCYLHHIGRKYWDMLNKYDYINSCKIVL